MTKREEAGPEVGARAQDSARRKSPRKSTLSGKSTKRGFVQKGASGGKRVVTARLRRLRKGVPHFEGKGAIRGTIDVCINRFGKGKSFIVAPGQGRKNAKTIVTVDPGSCQEETSRAKKKDAPKEKNACFPGGRARGGVTYLSLARQEKFEVDQNDNT